MMLGQILLLFSIVVCLPVVSLGAAGGGGEVGNGGGIAEQNIAFAYWNLYKYADLCLANPSCRLTPDEAILLNKIRGNLREEQASHDQIRYGSESGTPGSFHIDGQVRTAKTGDCVSSPIVFNRDLIYWRENSGATRALDIPGAVGILIHELGHHHQVKDHQSLELLGAKVQTMLLQKMQEIRVWPFLPHVGAVSFNLDSRSSFAQLLISDGDNQYDVSEQIKNSLDCGRDYPTGVLSGIWLWNLRWSLKNKSDGSVDWIITSGAFINCDFGVGSLPIGRYMVNIHVLLQQPPSSSLSGPQNFRISSEKVGIELTRCQAGDTECQ